jgi:hypothetical protein
MRRTLLLALILFYGSPALAETMLEQARTRGAASAQDFEDDPTNALPKIPWTTDSETSSLLGAEAGVARFAGNGFASKELGAGLVGQLRYSKLEQPELAGMWGQSWALALDTGFGAEGASYFGRGTARAQFGTMATLASAQHAFYLRFSGDLSTYRNSDNSFSTGFLSIPMGFRFKLKGAALELGGVSALGWSSVGQGSLNYGAGPLYFGAQSKLQTKVGFLEIQHLLAVSPAQAANTTLLSCGHYRSWIFCAEGTWLHLHDLNRSDEARFARVGIRIGFGSWESKTQHNQRKWVLPDVEAH